MKLTNKGLVAHVKALLMMLTVYVYGTYGKLLTKETAESKAKQYPKQNSAVRLKVYNTLVPKKYYAMDCVGVIKSYLWGGIENIKYDSTTDKSANGMYAAAKDKGNVDYKKYKHGVPEVPGIAVQMNGHIGVYIGNGKVVESTPNTKFAKQSHKMGGVCETQITDRKWEHWLYIPYIEYHIETEEKNPYNVPTKTIYYDAKAKKVVCTGDDVKWVQHELNKHGYGLTVDGKAGPATDTAIRDYQKKHNLVVDGKAGPNTRVSLQE